MTGQVFRRLAALVALVGVFAMHGLAVGHNSGECLTANHDITAHRAPAHGAAAPAGAGTHTSAIEADAPLAAATAVTAAAATAAAVIRSGILALAEGAVVAHGEPIVSAVDCGPLGVAGMCLAVLLAPMLLTLLLLAAWRRWAVLDLNTASALRGPPARPDPAGRIRGPSPVQLCVLRT